MRHAWIDGSKDSSPNSGLSEAIFAYCARVKMGGPNLYKGKLVYKPILSEGSPEADREGIYKILTIGCYLEILWLILIIIIPIILN